MKKLLLGALALAAAVAVPGTTLAATYAYVNTAGEVLTTEATTPTQALSVSGIHVRSGVMLVGSDDANVVGDDVPGT